MADYALFCRKLWHLTDNMKVKGKKKSHLLKQMGLQFYLSSYY